MWVPWDLAQLVPIPGRSWQKFTSHGILGAHSAPHRWETSHRLLDMLRASLMFLPRKPNFAYPSAMLSPPPCCPESPGRPRC